MPIRRCLAVLAFFACAVPFTARAAEIQRQFLEAQPHGRQFNVVTTIKPIKDQPQAAMLLCADDAENCYRVEFDKDSVKIVKMDMGFAIPIGSVSERGLSGKAPHQVIIKRRRMTITVVLDGKVAAQAYDDTFTRGKIGVAITGKSAAFQDFKMYDCGEVYFADDFMAEQAVSWKSINGDWSVQKADNPAFSANPFQYLGKAGKKPAVAAAVPGGSANWDNYSAAASFFDTGGDSVGLAFYYIDENNYHLFRLFALNAKKPSLQIVRVRDGEETVLAEAPGGFAREQYYRLQVDVHGTRVDARVDGNKVLAATDDYLVGGSIGLYTTSAKGTMFDDVLVKGLGYAYYRDDFAQYQPNTYLELGGEWSAESNTLYGKADGAAKVIIGDPRWRNYVVSCDILPPEADSAGVAFYYQDELNYFLYRLMPNGKRSVVRYFDGQKRELATADMPVSDKPERTVISIEDGLISVSVNGEQLMETFDPGLSEGIVGLCVENGTGAFQHLKVTTPPQPDPILSVTEAFKHEKSMAIYDWIADERPDSSGKRWFWHRADFFGDCTVELDMSKAEITDNTFEIALNAAAGDPTTCDPNTGYTLKVWKKGAWQLAITRNGKEVARNASVFNDSIWKLEFERKGSHLFGRINRKLEIWFKDDQPLDGCRIGYAAARYPAEDELQANVYCPNLKTYTFSRFAVDWRSAAGTWSLKNRWSCDPRWSWFCGEARNAPAIIWNKLSFDGDFSLEFCGAIKMDSSRGAEYAYARDLNATIAADGDDLNTGYSFLFGGWDNKRSCLVRKTEIVADVWDKDKFKFIRNGKMHREWWYFKVERIGSKLRWYIDNKLALEYDDPDPLDGKRIALWTYDVGIMVFRVRVGADEIGAAEPLGSQSTESCVYDVIPELK